MRTEICIFLIIVNVFGIPGIVAKTLEDLNGVRQSKEEVLEHLTDKNFIEEPLLTQYFGGNKTYAHSSKSLVLSVDWDGRGGMLFTDKELVYDLASNPQSLKSRHLLEGVFKHDNSFPELSKQLSEDFASEVMNYNCELPIILEHNHLEQLDRCIDMIGPKKILSDRKLFEGLISYIGEFAISHYNCNWDMVKSTNEQWEPWLVDDKKRKYSIFSVVFKELYNYKKGESSVVGSIIGELDKNKLTNGLK